MNNTERKKCKVENCNRPARYHGLSKTGKRLYHSLCETHYSVYKATKKVLDLKKCTLCGWRGPCDLHRIKRGKDGGGYDLLNSVVVCPNCHRLIHRGLLIL